MNISQHKLFKGANRHKKLSLIRILYIYPIIFFVIGLSTIIAYYTWLQINEFHNQVEKLKAEFPEKQRVELKSRVLLLKDYIAWVRSHPEEYANQHINNRMNSIEHLLKQYSENKYFKNKIIPESLTDSLDELNKRSIIKLVLLNNEQEVLYPEFPFRHEKGEDASKMLNNLYQVRSYESPESLVKEFRQLKVSENPYLLIRASALSEIKIGITYDPKQSTEILKETILDSLSKVKFSNNEYVIINTFDGFALLSKGKRQIPPIDIRNSSETNWEDIFLKELEFARQQDGGYLTYFWRNSTDTERSEKTSYFSGINEWEWIIGTGFFTNDINPVIDKLYNELWVDIINNLTRFIIFLLILSILAHLTMRYYAVKAKSNILLFLHFFKRAAQGLEIIDSE